MDYIYKNIEVHTPQPHPHSPKIIVINNPIVTELFIRGRKLNIFLVFVTQSYFAVPKNITLNPTHYFSKKIPNKQQLQQI